MPTTPTSVLTLSLLALVGLSAAAPKPRLTAYPRIALNNGVRIEAFVPRDARNRHIRVEVDGPYSRAFEEDMEGDSARVLYTLYIDQLPDGAYEAKMWVVRTEGKPLYLHTGFCRGEGCEAEVPQSPDRGDEGFPSLQNLDRVGGAGN